MAYRDASRFGTFALHIFVRGLSESTIPTRAIPPSTVLVSPRLFPTAIGEASSLTSSRASIGSQNEGPLYGQCPPGWPTLTLSRRRFGTDIRLSSQNHGTRETTSGLGEIVGVRLFPSG